jgi:hypothetical protein
MSARSMIHQCSCLSQKWITDWKRSETTWSCIFCISFPRNISIFGCFWLNGILINILFSHLTSAVICLAASYYCVWLKLTIVVGNMTKTYRFLWPGSYFFLAFLSLLPGFHGVGKRTVPSKAACYLSTSCRLTTPIIGAAVVGSSAPAAPVGQFCWWSCRYHSDHSVCLMVEVAVPNSYTIVFSSAL